MTAPGRGWRPDGLVLWGLVLRRLVLRRLALRRLALRELAERAAWLLDLTDRESAFGDVRGSIAHPRGWGNSEFPG